MTRPIVTENTVRREPVVRDSFIDDLRPANPRPNAR